MLLYLDLYHAKKGGGKNAIVSTDFELITNTLVEDYTTYHATRPSLLPSFWPQLGVNWIKSILWVIHLIHLMSHEICL